MLGTISCSGPGAMASSIETAIAKSARPKMFQAIAARRPLRVPAASPIATGMANKPVSTSPIPAGRANSPGTRFRAQLRQHRLARVLSVEPFPRCHYLAQMSARPQTERLHGLPQGATELGQFVIHTLRRGGKHSPLHQAVSLQSTQRECEHSL